MAATVLQTILSTIETKLAAILVASGYQTTVVSVSQIDDPPQLKTDATKYPYIWFGNMLVKSDTSDMDANLHHTDEEVALDLHLEVAYTTAALARPAILDLYSDVKKALHATWNMGLTAVKETSTDALHVGTIQGAESGFVSGICTFRFSYRHVYGVPTTGA